LLSAIFFIIKDLARFVISYKACYPTGSPSKDSIRRSSELHLPLDPIIQILMRIATILAFFALGLSGRVSVAEASSVTDLAPAEFELRLQELAKSPKWRRMIPKQVNGPGFLLAKNGANDPETELRGEIDAFRTKHLVGRPAQPAQCAFPARYLLLKKELKLTVQDVPCPELEQYLASFHAKGVSLVFSSAYPNNPGSMFGHTFLRFRTGRSSDLLDQTISFAAEIGGEQDLLFMFKGIFGGYQGHFTILPYYVKVNEYNNAESRDLVEYVLNFNEEEIQELLRYFWEIERNSWITYYFLDANCGSVLIDALQAVRPSLKIPRHGFYSIPTEVTRSITTSAGLIQEIKFRPSLLRKLTEFARELNKPQRKSFEAIVHPLPRGDASPIDADLEVLDTANVYFQYLKQKRGPRFTLDDQERANNYLIARSRTGVLSRLAHLVIPGEEESRPDLSHHAPNLSLAAGFLGGDPFQEIQLRSALQGLLDRDQGYVPFSEFQFPALALRWYPAQRSLHLERLNLVSIISLSPLTNFEDRLSWRAAVDWRTPRDQGEQTNSVFHMGGGAGKTIEFIHSYWVSYALFEGYAELGPKFHHGFRLGPVLDVGTVAKLTSTYKANFGAQLFGDMFQTDRQEYFYQLNLDQTWSIAQDWKLFFNGSQILPSRSKGLLETELETGLTLYF